MATKDVSAMLTHSNLALIEADLPWAELAAIPETCWHICRMSNLAMPLLPI
jgi:hypothetical protein